MKEIITFARLFNSGFKLKGKSNHSLSILCEACSSEYITTVKRFLWRPNREQLCTNCYFKRYVYSNPVWRKNNSDAQFISQNKPEQIVKNAIGVSKSWHEARRAKASELLRDRWANDPEFREKALFNLKWTDGSDIEQFNKIMSESVHKGRFCGSCNGVFYQSVLELGFLLLCEERQLAVVRFNLPPVAYEIDGDTKKYFPDFIVDTDMIVEVKSKQFTKWKNIQGIIDSKSAAAKTYYESIQKQYIIFYERDIGQRLYRKAQRMHKYYKAGVQSH